MEPMSASRRSPAIMNDRTLNLWRQIGSLQRGGKKRLWPVIGRPTRQA
jgi:hypothetical protein